MIASNGQLWEEDWDKDTVLICGRSTRIRIRKRMQMYWSVKHLMGICGREKSEFAGC